jgi:hypothetical protein
VVEHRRRRDRGRRGDERVRRANDAPREPVRREDGRSDITAAFSSFAAAYACGIEWSSHTGAWTSGESGDGKKKCSPRIERPCPAASDCDSFV